MFYHRLHSVIASSKIWWLPLNAKKNYIHIHEWTHWKLWSSASQAVTQFMKINFEILQSTISPDRWKNMKPSLHFYHLQVSKQQHEQTLKHVTLILPKPLWVKTEHAIRGANCPGHASYGSLRARAIKLTSASYMLKPRYFICLITLPHHNHFHTDL